MRTAAASLIALALFAGTADAQGRGRRANSQGIPPGHMPAAGECRVWYDGVPPGRQPRPTSCREAERIAARDRNARVIYGDDRYGDRYGTGRVYEDGRSEQRRGGNSVTDAIRDRILGRRTATAGARNNGYSAAYDNGYRDGLEKGREDRGDNDSFDPVRHSRYRSADRGYDSRYGTKEQYKLAYRDGFEEGYQQGYGRVVRR
ncbi:MAG TPA: hypothetical protein VJ691_07815 [Vicinamibacterales bacterium]|nr:hypothetical protein [Vicinamibacterales bacterium]